MNQLPEAPSGEETLKHLEANVTGPLPEPAPSVGGRYGAAVGETLGNPASWVAPGGLIKTGVGNVASALLGETARKQFEGPKFETPAEIIGGAPHSCSHSRNRRVVQLCK